MKKLIAKTSAIKETNVQSRLDSVGNSEHAQEFDFAFLGSGISTSFTLLHFLKKLQHKTITIPLRIAIIDKTQDFFTGIPYGNRSGSSALLITSLADFLPQPELGKFIIWLNRNKIWLLEEMENDGGILTQNWLLQNKRAIEENDWKDLFIPRRFFGKYISEKVHRKIKKAEKSGAVIVQFFSSTVENVTKMKVNYSIKGNGLDILAQNTILAIGSPPPQKIWEKEFEDSSKIESLKLFSNPYEVGLNKTIRNTQAFLENRKGTKTNILIIGSNASALEMLFKLNDYPSIAKLINKFILISTQGLLPDSIVDIELGKKFKPNHLINLKKRNNLTAHEIESAALTDLDYANEMGLGAATTVGIISKAFGALLDKLDPIEKEYFACYYGNEIGRRQRCAGTHYTQTVIGLKALGKFEHIAGSFQEIIRNGNADFGFRYTDTITKKHASYPDNIHLVINCIGSSSLKSDDLPLLYRNLMSSGLCVPNRSLKGFSVNENLETAENLHLIGPLLAGNVIDGKPVWHVEHCGRIIWLSEVLAEKLANKTWLEQKPIIL
ncbi:FAD/NAD(P)-binding protein [Flavobacteriaceae bacterium F89]|uniref:FAD/NAD(P)-binding protein n=1 Tax=Cerina litoralis TaxID=2874477 RepID=A0AAE3EWU9_9FLAO|nr:FAD/NAD(P)-binding protein [Cerina litoralis]MCG2461186.1 FAD/NAD(P)-binding protein [Cerina litoralis]